MRFKIILFLLPIVLTINVNAQPSSLGNWLMYFGNQPISAKFNLHNEIQYRNYNLVGELEQFIARVGIGHNLSKDNNNVLLGFGYFRSHNFVSELSSDIVRTNEYRIFQQFITKQQFNRFYIQHRYRVEERFIESDFKVRFRYFLGFNIPINSKTMDKKAFYLSAYNEIFIRDEKSAFDRDRYYGAIGYVVKKNLRVEMGYMNQQFNTGSRDQIQIAIFNSLPFLSN